MGGVKYCQGFNLKFVYHPIVNAYKWKYVHKNVL